MVNSTPDLQNMKVGPGTNGHILGTDTIGRDLFAECCLGDATLFLLAYFHQ